MDENPTRNDLCFSHVGFHVSDLRGMEHFYRTALKFTVTDRGRLGVAELVFLSRDPAEHHQIVLVSGRPESLPFNVINQVSFRVPDLDALRAHAARLSAAGARELEAVTHGNAISIYCRDPEGNRLELFLDTPWYCDQPLREPVDLAMANADILAQAEAIARRHGRFMPRQAWQARLAEQMRLDQHA